ncbi:MAG: site-specific integrase [Gammaproteobacteria bacterium]|nr:MAG: site-specific integrase [Gammaproteobacteria bacterium]
MTPLRQKMIDAMLVRGFSERTQRSYLDAVRQLAKYYHRSPDTLKTEQLQEYFLYLVKQRQLSSASCRLYLNGLRFLYLQVLGWESFAIEIHTPKRAQRIPELLSRREVARILSACPNIKHRVMLTTCYACGLRVSELVALQVKQIDSDRHVIRIEQAKGAKDRQVILGEHLLTLLRDYWQSHRPMRWLFYGVNPDRALSITSAQKMFTRAKHSAGIDKVGGIHALRHAYATHQLEAGMPVHQLQRLLGHNHLQSTMRYVHWVPAHQAGTGVDLLAGLEVRHD